MPYNAPKARLPKSVALALGLPLLVGTALAESRKPMPYERPDDSFISLSGTVVAPGTRSFELDYGSGTITVEMDDWDSYGEARPLMDGDNVTVYGRIDDDFFERTTIEAGAVYVSQLNAYLYASSMDEESSAYMPRLWVAPRLTPISEITLRGEVVDVDKKDKSFTVSIGDEDIQVETHLLGYNPVDDKGFQRVDKGDWVSVSGTLDYELIDGQVMTASTLTTLLDDSA
jgi:hypothetical protein